MTVHINPLLFEEEHLVRQVEKDKEIWFVGADVCRVLGISKVHQSLDRLDDGERGTCTVGTPGGDQDMIVVSEPGVYRLVFTSRKPVAERFKRWLAHEVIPSIRKTGGFAPETAPQSVEPDDTQSNDGVKLRHVTECRLTFGNKAAAQMWFHLGLPVVPEMLVDPRQLSIFDYQSIKSVEPGA
ncbi:BRO-N domain-containing protein [Pseudodonghicola flavimaris]|uniref:BRO family protein n=1 Tax=Pseudodonghicola flavimaris TaxID=3050036 RepID=A0ABT7F8M9_9RHOB|nr:BRO family protein [Pseudodonghicola flavimaris]MDK3020957.1 BRO family protein [Pseudodonghicola flavimaris]